MSDWMQTVMYNGDYGCIGCERTEYKFGYLPVTIYADTTRQYTEAEIEELQNSNWGQMIEIPVPEDLLFRWWLDDLDSNKNHWGKNAWESGDHEEFLKWFNEESTADDCDTLYDWLVKHNYCWKRMK